jgi:tetratricopeptide (TPR) repeat protein
MSLPVRLILFAGFALLGLLLLHGASVQAHAEHTDANKVILYFCGAILDGLILALLVAKLFVSAIGDRVGTYFFNPGEEIEHDPHADAIAKLAQGDPDGAIEVYEEILRKDPADTLAISEIARICCRDLGDTARAATVLERALAEEWPHEQSSFLGNRLADVYMLQEDPLRAREVIQQIAETMQGTRYGANAQHRLHEVERKIAAGLPSPAQGLLGDARVGPAGSPFDGKSSEPAAEETPFGAGAAFDRDSPFDARLPESSLPESDARDGSEPEYPI